MRNPQNVAACILLLLGLAASARAQEAGAFVQSTSPTNDPPPSLIAPEQPAALVTIDPTSTLAGDATNQTGRRRAGFVEPVPAFVNGVLSWTLSSANVWTSRVEIRSANAEALRIHIGTSDQRLNVAVRAYNPATGQVFPPEWPTQFGGAPGWWSPIVTGDTIGVEFACPRLVGDNVNPPQPPRITSVGRFQPEVRLQELTCHLDVNCYPYWDTAKNGVIKIAFAEPDNSMYMCSASFLNRNPSDACPIILSAHHCIDGDYAAQTMRAIFNYNSTGCNSGMALGEDTQAGPAFLLRGIGAYDTSVLGLLQSTPGGTVFLGWSVTPWPIHTSIAGIHHPAGSYKRFCQGDYFDSGIRQFEQIGDVSVWITQLTFGAIEPGSSGSPLLDVNTQQVRGPLTGGTAACGGMQAFYGRFDLAFSLFDQFLTGVPSTVWLSPTGIFGDRGTQARPFASIYEAYFCVAANGQVNALSGNYPDRPTFNRPMTINAIGGPVTFGN